MSRTRLQLSSAEMEALIRLAEGGSKRLAERARVVLLSDRGMTVDQISKELSMVAPTVYKWRKRYAEHGITGLNDLPRPGQPKKLNDDQLRALAQLLNEEIPEEGVEWSIRSLARRAKVTQHQARSLLHSSRPPPAHAPSSSNDSFELLPQLAGLYVAPPFLGATLVTKDPWKTALSRLMAQDTRELARPAAQARTKPTSLYRAFDVSSTRPGGSPNHVSPLGEMLGSVRRRLPPGWRVQVIAAPTPAVDATAAIDDLRSTDFFPVARVTSWLATMEALLERLGHVSHAPETSWAEVQHLRNRLWEHNHQQAAGSGAMFVWHNPKLGDRCHPFVRD